MRILAALVLGLVVILASSSGWAACSSPAGTAGSLDWFSGTTEFKYCDGGTWQTIGSGGLWDVSGSDVYYASGKTGIGVATPAVRLDVNGAIRINDDGTPCNPTYDGTLRYNSANKTVEFCDGANWREMAGEAVSTCAVETWTTIGEHSYTVVAGCETLQIEAWGAGGGAGTDNGGGGGASSRVEKVSDGTIYALGAGGGGGAGDAGSMEGGGGGGGYGKKVVTLAIGENLKIVVGEGGENGCGTYGGVGGNPGGGTAGNGSPAGSSTLGGFGGGGGADAGWSNGGDSTYGGSGGGGNSASNTGAATTYGGAGGADPDFGASNCGTSTSGGTCGGVGSGGGGGGGLGDVVLLGFPGTHTGGGTAANDGPGDGANPTGNCPARGGNGKVVIRPL